MYNVCEESLANFNLLFETYKRNPNFILWIGAGTSKWNGYPLWGELARELLSNFTKFHPTFDKVQAAELLKAYNYPELFDLIFNSNKQLYHRIIAERFKSKRSNSPVYNRFVNAMLRFTPLQILTTNVDELLEQNLHIDTIQHADIDRLPELMKSNNPFVCKIHGSISNIDSLVFTAKDYEKITSNKNYLEIVETIFNIRNVLFIGTSVSDKYILEIINSRNNIFEKFGNGPHFAIVDTNSDIKLYDWFIVQTNFLFC